MYGRLEYLFARYFKVFMLPIVLGFFCDVLCYVWSGSVVKITFVSYACDIPGSADLH